MTTHESFESKIQCVRDQCCGSSTLRGSCKIKGKLGKSYPKIQTQTIVSYSEFLTRIGDTVWNHRLFIVVEKVILNAPSFLTPEPCGSSTLCAKVPLRCPAIEGHILTRYCEEQSVKCYCRTIACALLVLIQRYRFVGDSVFIACHQTPLSKETKLYKVVVVKSLGFRNRPATGPRWNAEELQCSGIKVIC